MLSLNDLATPFNPLVVALLRSPLHALASKGLMLLAWTGRTSGRRYTIPVGYQHDGQSLVVMVSKVGRQFGIAYERGRELDVDQRSSLVSNCGAVRFDLDACSEPGATGA